MMYDVVVVRLEIPKAITTRNYKNKHFVMISKIYVNDKYNSSTIWIKSYKFLVTERIYYRECTNYKPY